MSDAARVNATEFARHFGRYVDEAARGGVVEVTKGRKLLGGFVSATQLTLFQEMRLRSKPEVVTAGAFDDETVALLQAAVQEDAPD